MAIKVPFTTTVTNHGLMIQVNGKVIGAITSWSTKMGRGATPVFEFGGLSTGTIGGGGDIQADPGEPYEVVPGNLDGTSISINRYDIYTSRFETAFGTNNLMSLTRQDKAINLMEFFSTPDNLEFRYCYYGAWFKSIGRQHDAKGDRIVMANAELIYTRRRELF